MDGVLLVNKLIGGTSYDVVERVKRRTGERSVGHTGTLDPRASGLLILLLGRATKLAPYLNDLDKTYETTIRLGVTTTTDDLDGEIVRELPVPADRGAIEAALTKFVGTIQQRPPDYSAVKVGGVPAYKRARAGEQLELAARNVTIQAIEPLGFDPLRLRVTCSGGTYIRALARDLGEALGCGGAVAELCRTRIGPFTLEHAAQESAIDAELVQPPDTAVSFLPEVTLLPENVRDFTDGKPIPGDGSGHVRVYGPDGFIGIADAENGNIKAIRVLFGR